MINGGGVARCVWFNHICNTVLIGLCPCSTETSLTYIIGPVV